jgi:predicted GH43/DUF377 family glycosyl hydrolase
MGLVFSPAGRAGWMNSHAQVPTPLLRDGVLRIYFSSRPRRDLSLTTFADLDPHQPSRILAVNQSPLLEAGRPGTFDEHGIMPSFAIADGDEVLLYYSGWSRGSSVPYTNSTGLAISRDGGRSFRRYSEGPILARNVFDPFSATSPCVLRDGRGWHMWYCSGTGWLDVQGRFEHTYDIKYARSDDGRTWAPTGQVAVGQRNPYEAITRPYVMKRPDGYHMWFCYRGSHDFRTGGDAYRVGTAFSSDLREWQRRDAAADLVPAATGDGWDSQMVAYPALVELGDRLMLFYNGNGFGAEGFGWAQWSAGQTP